MTITPDDVHELLDLGLALLEGVADVNEPDLVDAIEWARATAPRVLIELAEIDDASAWLVLFTLAELDRDNVLASILWELKSSGVATAECPACNHTFAISSDDHGARITDNGRTIVIEPRGDAPHRAAAITDGRWDARVKPMIVLAHHHHPRIADAIRALARTMTCQRCGVPQTLGTALCTGR